MNYIILDTEWDNHFWKKRKKCVNELVEIGAVKLDKDLQIIDTFRSVIKSQISKKLSKRFVDFTGITTEEMMDGVPLLDALSAFAEWSGDDCLTLTWSDSDIYTMLFNCKDFLGLDYIPGITKYADAQKFVQSYLKDEGFIINSQISLENAATCLNVKIDNIQFHRAFDDSLMTAELFKKAFSHCDLKPFIINTKNGKFYSRISFKPYIINDIKSKYVKKSSMFFKCGSCHKKAKRQSDWHFKGSSFRAEFLCKNCGERFIGNISFKKNFDKVTVRKFKQEITNEEK